LEGIIMTNQQHRVGGVDSHKDTIHVAVVTEVGQPVTDKEFPTTTAGCRRAVAWLIEPDPGPGGGCPCGRGRGRAD